MEVILPIRFNQNIQRFDTNKFKKKIDCWVYWLYRRANTNRDYSYTIDHLDELYKINNCNHRFMSLLYSLVVFSHHCNCWLGWGWTCPSCVPSTISSIYTWFSPLISPTAPCLSSAFLVHKTYFLTYKMTYFKWFSLSKETSKLKTLNWRLVKYTRIYGHFLDQTKEEEPYIIVLDEGLIQTTVQDKIDLFTTLNTNINLSSLLQRIQTSAQYSVYINWKTGSWVETDRRAR